MAKWKWTTGDLTLDASEFGRVRDRIYKHTRTPKRFLEILGDEVLESSQRAFDSERSPLTGQFWKKNRPNTVAAKGHANVLIRTGKLRRSLERGKTGAVWRMSNTRLVVGSRLKTAHYAQRGTRKHTIKPKRAAILAFITTDGPTFAKSVKHPGTPPRPFLGASKRALKRAEAKMATLLDQLQRRS